MFLCYWYKICLRKNAFCKPTFLLNTLICINGVVSLESTIKCFACEDRYVVYSWSLRARDISPQEQSEYLSKIKNKKRSIEDRHLSESQRRASSDGVGSARKNRLGGEQKLQDSLRRRR